MTDSPQELADTVHEAINAGTIKDRLTIQLDPDLRYGEVRIDDQILYTKLVDLPTVVESYKTIDNKSFYKSADICQILICKEEREDETEKESPNKNKRRTPTRWTKYFSARHHTAVQECEKTTIPQNSEEKECRSSRD